MNGNMHDLAAAYALDALSEAERTSFEAHLLECAECREQVAALKEASVELVWDAATNPPAQLRQRVLTAIDSIPQEAIAAVTPITATPSRARPRRRWIPATIAAVVAVLALLGWSIFGSGGILNEILDDPASITIEAAATEAGEAAFSNASVVFSPEREASVLVIEGLNQLGTDRTYELWLIGDAGPIPAGLFRPDADGGATVLIEGESRPGLVVALTEEPAGGVDAPTGEVLFTAKIGA